MAKKRMDKNVLRTMLWWSLGEVASLEDLKKQYPENPEIKKLLRSAKRELNLHEKQLIEAQ